MHGIMRTPSGVQGGRPLHFRVSLHRRRNLLLLKNTFHDFPLNHDHITHPHTTSNEHLGALSPADTA
jgi:hypothetical protein